MRGCRSTSPSHWVPWGAAITCKTCHGSQCFTHLLDINGLHSVEAISVSGRYGADLGWHQHHQQAKAAFDSSLATVIQDEEAGRRPDISKRLAYLARTYGTIRANNTELTKSGWYDRYVQATVIPVSLQV